MSYIFIEMYNENEQWAALPEAQRETYIETVLSAVGQVASMGIEVLAYGRNLSDVDNRAPYSFYAIYKVPEKAALEGLQQAIRSSGWYQYFDQANIAGESVDPAEILRSHVRGGRTE